MQQGQYGAQVIDRSAPAIEGVNAEIARLAGRVDKVAFEIGLAANRIFGSRPDKQANASDAPRSVPSSTVDHLREMEAMINRLESETQRLT